jgi:hypothetical protein
MGDSDDGVLKKYFRVLEIPEGASPSEIKRAYRDLAQVWHPDKHEGNPRLRAKAEEKIKLINEAYERLSAAHASQKVATESGANDSNKGGSKSSPPESAGNEPAPPSKRLGCIKLVLFFSALIVLKAIRSGNTQRTTSQSSHLVVPIDSARTPAASPMPFIEPTPQKNDFARTPAAPPIPIIEPVPQKNDSALAPAASPTPLIEPTAQKSEPISPSELVPDRYWKTLQGFVFYGKMVRVRKDAEGYFEGLFIDDRERAAWIRIGTLRERDVDVVRQKMIDHDLWSPFDGPSGNGFDSPWKIQSK